ncbi:MAG: transcriptional repressor [Aquificaceae bacterium]|nr:MAG: transcriptional repressor [Aquificaceae bacterium]
MPTTADKEEKRKILGEIKEKLKERGLKITEARLKVISYLIDYGKHFEIEDLVIWIRERCKDYRNCPSRPTVYRTVKLLEDLGYVKPVLKQGNKTVYEFLPIEREHYHLLCLSCGKLVEFEEPFVGKIVQEIAQKKGFKYLHHHLEVCGICQDCLKKEKEN